MNIDLIAKMKDYQTFVDNYSDGDEVALYEGKSLLFYAMSNNDAEARYRIVMFLLDKGLDACCLNEENETLLHVLFSRVKHNLEQTIEMCEILLKKGVDINHLDKKNRSAFQYVINMKYTDEMLLDLYKVIFSKSKVNTSVKNDWGFSLLDLAQKLPYRNVLIEHLTNQ